MYRGRRLGYIVAGRVNTRARARDSVRSRRDELLLWVRRDGVQHTHSRRHRRACAHDDGVVLGKTDERERQPVAGTKRVFANSILFYGMMSVWPGRGDAHAANAPETGTTCTGARELSTVCRLPRTAAAAVSFTPTLWCVFARSVTRRVPTLAVGRFLVAPAGTRASRP